MRVCFSGNGQGAVAAAIRAKMDSANFCERTAVDGPVDMPYEFVLDAPRTGPQQPCDVAICTTGAMRIRRAEDVDNVEEAYLYNGNYLWPKMFTERHIEAMRASQTHGLIIHIGSNAAWYGNVHAEGYAAYKTALRKYLELRGRMAKGYGIRISLLGFGGIEGPFWDKATAGVSSELTKGIVSGDRRMLSLDEAATVVMATIRLPDNICVRDALIVSTDYQ